FQVRHQGRGIHRDQYVGLVARGEDLVARKIELEAADPGQGSRRSANFRGKVGQRRDVVTCECRLRGKLHPGQLHPIARVARKADDDPIPLQLGFLCAIGSCLTLRPGTLRGSLRWYSHLSPISLSLVFGKYSGLMKGYKRSRMRN